MTARRRNALKFLTALLGLIFVSSPHAAMLGLGAGGLTTHYTNINENVYYCNRIGNSGVITNPSLYVRLGWGNQAISLFKGEDSICSPIYGSFFDYMIYRNQSFNFSFVYGGYEFRKRHWDRYAENVPDGWKPPEPTYVRFGGTTIVPVVGVGLSFRLYGNFWLNNIISFVITNHTIEYRISF